MRAVNLIPADARRGGRGPAGRSGGAAYVLLGSLALLLVLVTVYVLATNSISDRKAKVANLQVQVSQAQAQAARLSPYAQFAQLAQARAETVRQIAATRFDWHKALSDLSRVVPANTSLQSLVGTVAPGASAGGSSAAGVSGLRSAIAAPAFEISGCTSTQDDVARLMSRLRLIDGVTRVSLSDSQKSDSGQSGAAVSATGTGSGGCGSNTPAFHLVVFFQPLPGAGPSGVTSVSPQPVSNTTGTSGGSK
jgi:Tfp pilus assembly protein PilN